MNLSKKDAIIIAVAMIIIVLIISCTAVIYLSNNNHETKDIKLTGDDLTSLSNVSLPDGPTTAAKIDTTGVNSQLLASDEKGTVEILGPFGNTNSNVKIAYLTGMHPLESKAHKALFDVIKAKSSSLNYCYYVYRTNVTLNPEDDAEGRMNGQLLAQKYVAPDIISKKYNLVVDIHGNRGMNGGSYEETNFIFAPGNDEKSLKIANVLIDEIDGFCSYVPASQTSPPYITIPVEEAGTPTIICETGSYNQYNHIVKLMTKLVENVDNLSF